MWTPSWSESSPELTYSRMAVLLQERSVIVTDGRRRGLCLGPRIRLAKKKSFFRLLSCYYQEVDTWTSQGCQKTPEALPTDAEIRHTDQGTGTEAGSDLCLRNWRPWENNVIQNGEEASIMLEKVKIQLEGQAIRWEGLGGSFMAWLVKASRIAQEAAKLNLASTRCLWSHNPVSPSCALIPPAIQVYLWNLLCL